MGTDWAALLKDALQQFIKGENIVPLILGTLVAIVGSFTVILAPPLWLGLTNIALKIARGETAKLEDMWYGFSRFGSSLAFAIIAGIMVVLGFALLFLPGLILCFLLTYSFQVMIANPSYSVFEVIKGSVEIAKNNVAETLVLWVVMIALSAVLSMTMIGALISTPFNVLLGAMLFVRLARSPASAAV